MNDMCCLPTTYLLGMSILPLLVLPFYVFRGGGFFVTFLLGGFLFFTFLLGGSLLLDEVDFFFVVRAWGIFFLLAFFLSGGFFLSFGPRVMGRLLLCYGMERRCKRYLCSGGDATGGK
jgi:hypothetical protein